MNSNDLWLRGRKLWALLGPVAMLLGILFLFGALIACRDLLETRESAETGTAFAELIKTCEWPSFKAFFSWDNGTIVLTQTVVVSLGALAMTFIIISGGIDLSLGSTIALVSVVGAVLLREKTTVVAAVVGAIGAGCLVGVLNGILVATFRLTPFIVTLGMLGVARGAAKWIAGNQTVNFTDPRISQWMNTSDGGLPWGVWLALLLALGMGMLLQRTVFGRHVFAIGSNVSTARLCGIGVKRNQFLVYVLGGALAGIAGLMQLSRLQQGDPTSAMGLELDVIAAVVIGGASLSGGTGSVMGSMLGALTMAVLRTGSQYMDWPNYMQEIIIGSLIILAVAMDRWRQREKQ